MRWKSLLVGCGLMLVAATACGVPGESGSGGGGPSTPPPSTGSPAPPSTAPLPPVDRNAVPADRVDFSALPPGFPHEVWTSGDEKTLYIRAEEGGCSRASAQVRDQTPQRVAVHVVETQTLVKGQMCTMIIRYPVVAVPLAEPLGNRKVVLTAETRPN